MDNIFLQQLQNGLYLRSCLNLRSDYYSQGVNVREKAKVVLVLMEDDEKLREEREFAVKTREKTSKSSAGEILMKFKLTPQIWENSKS